ncbi:uncharacterized protein LOC122263766 [Penaeus japonicus]|uniref:uncharacterized protein LOC122263766 n=1 Tax=Penaeus japonicus TaxID=27405 RepID=UPI001C71270C|nr:uncharacterized protein LOC122263766 [Penaeus japonicus]
MEWTSCLIIDLLEKIKSRPIVWDVRKTSYHKKTLRRSHFDVVCREMKSENPELQKLTTDEVIAKFAYLRGHYQKQLRKIQKSSGSGGIVQSKWEYFEACSFLMPIYASNKITASFQLTSKGAQELVFDGTEEELLETSETSPLTASSPEPPNSSPSPVPTVTFPPRSPVPCTPPAKKRKHHNNRESVHKKLVEAVNGVNSLIDSRKNTVMKNDLLALTVSSVLSQIPDTHQHLKDEFAAQVMSLAADILKKYNSEKYGQLKNFRVNRTEAVSVQNADHGSDMTPVRIENEETNTNQIDSSVCVNSQSTMRGLRNFRMDKEESSKDQTPLLQNFRKEMKSSMNTKLTKKDNQSSSENPDDESLQVDKIRTEQDSPLAEYTNNSLSWNGIKTEVCHSSSEPEDDSFSWDEVKVEESSLFPEPVDDPALWSGVKMELCSTSPS